jgi:hypothetical protein
MHPASATGLRRRVLFAALVALLAIGLLNQERILDWFRLYGYQPTAQVQSLVTADGFSGQAEHLFYINRPEIVAKSNFRQYCTTQAEKTIVLGCYRGVQHGIYVLKITDDARLDGVMQVTAAHEMLHAGYDRLSTSERQQIDGWLQAYYDKGLHDERIKQTIESYKSSEPDALLNEMHSIFATEVAELPQPLEQYYSRYFDDRSVVVGYANDYQAEFTSRKQQVAAYDNQLATLKQLIDEQEASLEQQAADIRSAGERLNRLRASGDAAPYNAGVAPYNQSIERYNRAVVVLKQQIAQYNQLVETRNAVALEQQQLTQELSGDDVAQIPKQ